MNPDTKNAMQKCHESHSIFYFVRYWASAIQCPKGVHPFPQGTLSGIWGHVTNRCFRRFEKGVKTYIIAVYEIVLTVFQQMRKILGTFPYNSQT